MTKLHNISIICLSSINIKQHLNTKNQIDMHQIPIQDGNKIAITAGLLVQVGSTNKTKMTKIKAQNMKGIQRNRVNVDYIGQ